AKLIGDLDAFVRMVDVFLAFSGVRADEVLMNRKANRLDAIAKGVAFELLQIRTVAGAQWVSFRDVHLPMEDVDSFNADLGGFIDNRFDGDALGFKMPVRIRGDGQFNALLGGGSGSRARLIGPESERGTEASGTGEESAAIEHRTFLSFDL